jgi:putative ABC transport system permease protein
VTPDLSYLDLGVVSLLVLASIGLSLFERLGLGRDIIVSCLRAFVQLTLVGIVLGALFRNVHFYWVALALAIMIAAAVQAGRSRVESNVPRLTGDMTIAIGSVSAVTLAFVIGAVVRPGLWYDPQIVIPLAGMTIGNTMTATTLAANRFATELRQRQNDVEALLALGATADQAAADVVRESVRSALIPSIAGMMVVGLVSLPGMMTGQILAGQDPSQAVRYQIVIQYMLLFAAFATSLLIVRLIRRRYFTRNHQLRWDLLRSVPSQAVPPVGMRARLTGWRSRR